MREIQISLGTIVAALLVVAAVVFAGRDAALLVPPPEAVAEDFARKLGSGRYDLARRHLSSRARESQTAVALEARFEPVRARMGAIDGAEATEMSRDAKRAWATSTVTGEHEAVTMTVELSRERGLWVIDSWKAAETAR